MTAFLVAKNRCSWLVVGPVSRSYLLSCFLDLCEGAVFRLGTYAWHQPHLDRSGGPQHRFLVVSNRSVTWFGSSFEPQSLLVGACSENFLVCTQYRSEATLGSATSFIFGPYLMLARVIQNMIGSHHKMVFIFCSFRFRIKCPASWMPLGLHWGLIPSL